MLPTLGPFLLGSLSWRHGAGFLALCMLEICADKFSSNTDLNCWAILESHVSGLFLCMYASKPAKIILCLNSSMAHLFYKCKKNICLCKFLAYLHTTSQHFQVWVLYDTVVKIIFHSFSSILCQISHSCMCKEGYNRKIWWYMERVRLLLSLWVHSLASFGRILHSKHPVYLKIYTHLCTFWSRILHSAPCPETNSGTLPTQSQESGPCTPSPGRIHNIPLTYEYYWYWFC